MESAVLTRVRMRPAAVQLIVAARDRSTTEEPCGVLLGRIDRGVARIEDAPALPNTHATPQRAFRIAPQDILRVAKAGRAQGLTVLGFWHGHLCGAAEPGEEDLEGMIAAEALGPSARLLVVVGRGAGRASVVRAWTRDPRGEAPHEIPLGT